MRTGHDFTHPQGEIEVCTVTEPAVGMRLAAMQSSSVDFPAPLSPMMPTRSAWPTCSETSRSTVFPPSRVTETPSRSTTCFPRRGMAAMSSKSPGLASASGRPSMRARAASIRACGFRVRAFAPRRSQANSVLARLRRVASAEAASSSRRAFASKYEL